MSGRVADRKRITFRRSIYLNEGFKIIDIIDYENGRSMALYELEV